MSLTSDGLVSDIPAGDGKIDTRKVLWVFKILIIKYSLLKCAKTQINGERYLIKNISLKKTETV
jgi:hypothetical protein